MHLQPFAGGQYLASKPVAIEHASTVCKRLVQPPELVPVHLGASQSVPLHGSSTRTPKPERSNQPCPQCIAVRLCKQVQIQVHLLS